MTVDMDHGIEVLLTRLRKVTKDYRLPVQQSFRDFDALRLKRIPRSQFIRALKSAGFELSPAEAQQLADAFRSKADPLLVDYEEFVDTLTSVFSIKGLDKNPSVKVHLPLQDGCIVKLGIHKAGLTDAERGHLSDLLRHLAHVCHNEGVDFPTLLSGFDSRHIGQVTRNNFTRGIYPLLKKDSDKDALLLARAYEVPETGLVHYKTMAEHMRTLVEARHHNHAPRGLAHPQLSKVDKARIRDALSRLARTPEASTDPEMLSKAFQQHDYNQYGVTSTHDFVKTLDRLWDPPLSKSVQQVMTLAYALRDGVVDYRILDADYKAVVAAEEVVGKNAGDRHVAAVEEHADEAHKLESIVAHRVLEGRIKLIDAFLEHDKLRSGRVSRDHFHRILSQCLRAPLADDLFQALVSKHARDTSGQVDYTSFLRAVDDIASHTFPASSLVEKDHLTAEEKARLGPILDRIRYLVTSQRINIRPIFDDFDRTHELHCSTEQFLRVLTIFSILPAAPADQQLLVKAYQPPNPLDARSHMLNYVRFIAEVDATAFKLPRAEALGPLNHVKWLSKSAAARKPEDMQKSFSVTFLGRHDRSTGTIKKEIKAYVLKNRVNLAEYLQEPDRLRQGFVTRSQLLRALSRAGIRLTESEVHALCDLHRMEGEIDAQGKPCVRYRELLEEVEQVFTVKELEKKPDVPAEEAVTHTVDETFCTEDADKGNAGFTAVEQKKLNEGLAILAREIGLKRVELLYSFKDQDRQNRSYVSSNNFIRVISSANVVTSQYLGSISDVLVRKFREVFSTGATYVNYRAFLEAMRAINELGASPADVKDTSRFRFELRKGAAPPQIHRVPAPAANNQAHNDADESAVLQKIKKQTAFRRINLGEFLPDGDSLHSGDVSRSHFRASLTRAGVNLCASELDLLEARFADSRRNDHVNYKKFYDALRAMSCPGHLRRIDTM